MPAQDLLARIPELCAYTAGGSATDERPISATLAAMGVDADRSLRASVGWSSTDEGVDAFLDALPVVVDLLRALRR